MTIEISAKELAEFDHERSRATDFAQLPPWSDLDDCDRREWIESARAGMADGGRIRRYRDARDLLLLRKAIDRYRDAQDAADKARKLGPRRVTCQSCKGCGVRFDLIETYGYAPNCGACGATGTVCDISSIDAAEAEERIALEELEEARRRVDE